MNVCLYIRIFHILIKAICCYPVTFYSLLDSVRLINKLFCLSDNLFVNFFVCVSTYPSICLSIYLCLFCLFIYLSFCLSFCMCLSISLCIFQSVCLFINLSIHLFVLFVFCPYLCLSFYLSSLCIFPSVTLSVYLSFYVSIHLPVFLSVCTILSVHLSAARGYYKLLTSELNYAVT